LFDSQKESQRAYELDILCRSGAVARYELQPVFRIEHNGVKVCKYIADFKVEWADGSTTYEDVKGVRTPVFILKKKLVKAFYGIEIIEI
jgi:hypothetical protein